MRRLIFLYLLLVFLIFSFEIFAQNTKGKGIIEVTNKPVQVIEYHRLDGSIWEKYDNAPGWVELKHSPKSNPFFNLKKSRTVYEYTNFKGETFETYDFNTFRFKSSTETSPQDETFVINESSLGFHFAVVPNPVEDDYISLRITTGIKSHLTLLVTNILGFEVAKIDLGTVEPGTHMKKIKNQLLPGFYRLILTDLINSREAIIFLK